MTTRTNQTPGFYLINTFKLEPPSVQDSIYQGYRPEGWDEWDDEKRDLYIVLMDDALVSAWWTKLGEMEIDLEDEIGEFYEHLLCGSGPDTWEGLEPQVLGELERRAA